MAAWFRLAWRLQRSELRILLGACLLVAAAGVVVAWQLACVQEAAEACISGTGATAAVASQCQQLLRSVEPLGTASTMLHSAIAVAPFVLGFFLGIPVVSREVEGGTAPLAWSLALSRRSWFLGRLLPVLIVALVAAAAIALSGELLTGAVPRPDGTEIGFDDYAMRGPLVVVRAFAILMLGVAVGAVVPRQLPGVLVAAVLTVALLGANQVTMSGALQAVAELRPAMASGDYPMVYGNAWRNDATGELLSDEELYASHPQAGTTGEPAGFSNLMYIVPARRAGEFVLRESIILTVAGCIALGFAIAVVGRRRPY